VLPTCKDAARLPNSTGLSGQSAALIDLVLDSVAAAHTKRAYRRCLLQFFQRLQQAEDYQALNRRTVQ
jgi:hypothetical protein